METDWVLSSEVELGLVSPQQNQRYYCSFHLVGLKLWKIKQDQQLNQDIHITSKRQLLWVNVLYFPFVWTTGKLHTWVVFPHHRYWWAVILPTRLPCQNNNQTITTENLFSFPTFSLLLTCKSQRVKMLVIPLFNTQNKCFWLRVCKVHVTLLVPWPHIVVAALYKLI